MSDQLTQKLYKCVYLIRQAEEKVRELYPSDVMKTPVHLSLGEEAIVAGVVAALSSSDLVFGTYRSHALYLAKGGELDQFFGELYGVQCGVAGGKAGSMHLSAPDVGFLASSAVVASIIPVAMGAAFAARYRQSDQIAAVFFGDGATEEGAFWETLNFATLKQLPLLMVCEDNGLAIHAHINDRQSYSIADAAKAFTPNVISAQTTDAEEIHHLTRTAVRQIHAGNGPWLLHLRYHRYLEHVGIHEDYTAGYRSREEACHWHDLDPVSLLRCRLLDQGMNEETLTEMEREVDLSIAASVARVGCSNLPSAEELDKDVYT